MSRSGEQTEAQLQRALADLDRTKQEFEQFTHIVSHDLQGPLRNVAGFSQLLSRRYAQKLEGDGLEFLQFIEQGVKQMQAMVRDLLSLSRVTRTDTLVESRPLDEALRRALVALKPEIEACKAQVDFEPMPATPAVQTQMVQLFQHLISNAIKFRKPDKQAQIVVRSEIEDDAVHVRIQDQGIGIPADQLGNVFLVFRRLHGAEEFEGTGMGLALCRRIVQHHRGELWAESDESGTCLHLRLPS
ncbi:MAG: sensor histidine kinase [Panacagrimonas sp.]